MSAPSSHGRRAHETTSSRHPGVSKGISSWSAPRAQTGKADYAFKQAETDPDTFGAHRHPWKPLWVRRWFLATLATVFTLFVAGLLLLFFLSQSQQGISLLTTNHYTWTYAPTTILILTVAIWRQVDHYIKALKPWDLLARGEGEAATTVLLDYISPIQLTSFYCAFKNRHVQVVFSTIAFTLLKLVTLASTGLLLPVVTQIETSAPSITKTATFNGTLFSASQSPTLNDTSLVYTAYGIATKDLSSPDGIHKGIVFEPFEMVQTQIEGNATVTAEVNALLPRFICESAPVEIILQPPNVTDEHPEDIIQIMFPECTMADNFTGRSAYVLNPQTFLTPARQLSPVMQPIRCFNGSDDWQLLTISDFRYEQNVETDGSAVFGDQVQASSWSTVINRTTSVACRPTYSRSKVNITYDLSSGSPSISIRELELRDGNKVEGLTDFDLGRMFTASLTAASDMFGNVLEGAYDEEYPQTMAKLMAAMGTGSYEDLFNETTMIERADAAFQAVAAQILHKYFVQNVSDPLDGILRSQEVKLHVNEVSLWVMVGGLGLTVAFAALLIIFPLKHDVPHDPEPLLNVGKMLAGSQRAQTVFQLCKYDRSLGCLQHYRFSTTSAEKQDQDFQLRVTGSQEISPDLREKPPPAWWRPFFTQRSIIFLTLALPLACIVVLEVLQRRSDDHEGFANVASAESLAVKFTTRYLPALILITIASMVNAIDFNILVLAPFQEVKEGWTDATGPMRDPVLGKIPLHTLFLLLKHRNWGPYLSTIGSLLATLLTIVVSGLYTINTTPYTIVRPLQSLDTVDSTWSNSATVDNGAAVVLSLTESASLADPPFTYEDLVFPSLALSDIQDRKITSNATVQVQVPALRARLSCSSLNDTSFNTTLRYSSNVGPSAFIEANASLPSTCLLGGPNGNESVLSFTQTFQWSLSTNTSYLGKLLDLHVGPFNETTMSSAGEIDANAQADNPVGRGCPSLAFVWGYVDVNDEASSNVSVMVCQQHLETTLAQVSLSYPELLVYTLDPPWTSAGTVVSVPAIPLNDSVNESVLSNDDPVYSFSFRPQSHFDRKFSIFTQDQFDSSNSARAPVDNFFQGVLFGRDKIPIERLNTLEDGDNSLQWLDVRIGIEALYGRYMAQVASSNMRQPLPSATSDEATPSEFTAAITDSSAQLRVKQNNVSKLILQVLLGIIFVCMGLAVKITKMREVVMFNPCCIAGVAVLWANSPFCRVSRDTYDDDASAADGNSTLLTHARGLSEVSDTTGTVWRDGDHGVRGVKAWEFKLGWDGETEEELLLGDERAKGKGEWGILSRWREKGLGIKREQVVEWGDAI